MAQEKKKINQGGSESKIIYPVRETHVYNGDDIPGMKLLELKHEVLLERMRILECALLKMYSRNYNDKDVQPAKHKKKTACMCCSFLTHLFQKVNIGNGNAAQHGPGDAEQSLVGAAEKEIVKMGFAVLYFLRASVNRAVQVSRIPVYRFRRDCICQKGIFFYIFHSGNFLGRF